MSPIFISYKRADYDLVVPIKERIESALNVECWFDYDSIECSAVFPVAISKAIDNCKVFLFMYSKEHLEIKDFKNDWSLNELNYARMEKKLIILVHIDDSPLNGAFRLEFSSSNNIYIKDEKQFDKLIHDIEKHLKPEDCNQSAKTNAKLEELARREKELEDKKKELEYRERKILHREQEMKHGVETKDKISGFEDSTVIKREVPREVMMKQHPVVAKANASTQKPKYVWKNEQLGPRDINIEYERSEHKTPFRVSFIESINNIWERFLGIILPYWGFSKYDFDKDVGVCIYFSIFRSVTPFYCLYHFFWQDSQLAFYVLIVLLCFTAYRVFMCLIVLITAIIGEAFDCYECEDFSSEVIKKMCDFDTDDFRLSELKWNDASENIALFLGSLHFLLAHGTACVSVMFLLYQIYR